MARVSMDADDARLGRTRDAEVEALDRRRSRRSPVTVRIDYASVDEMFSEFTRDINDGGLFIETDKPQAPGTEVTMQFQLPGSEDTLETVGRVVRVTPAALGRPGGMGIEFDELTPDDRRKIDRMVRALRSVSDR